MDTDKIKHVVERVIVDKVCKTVKRRKQDDFLVPGALNHDLKIPGTWNEIPYRWSISRDQAQVPVIWTAPPLPEVNQGKHRYNFTIALYRLSGTGSQGTKKRIGEIFSHTKYDNKCYFPQPQDYDYQRWCLDGKVGKCDNYLLAFIADFNLYKAAGFDIKQGTYEYRAERTIDNGNERMIVSTSKPFLVSEDFMDANSSENPNPQSSVSPRRGVIKEIAKLGDVKLDLLDNIFLVTLALLWIFMWSRRARIESAKREPGFSGMSNLTANSDLQSGNTRRFDHNEDNTPKAAPSS